jgi:hypothetical protein
MRPALDPAGHRVPRTKPTCLLYTWRPHRRRPFALVLHLHQHESSRNLHLQYLAKNQCTQRCQSLITQGSDHPPVLEPHMVLRCEATEAGPKAASAPKVRRSWTRGCRQRVKRAPHEAETRGATCKGVSAVRRHAGGLYDAGSYFYTLVKCLKPFVRNGKGVIEANDYTQGSPINSEPLVMKRTHCNEKRAPKATACLSVFGLLSISLFLYCTVEYFAFPFLALVVEVASYSKRREGKDTGGCCVGVHPSGPISTNTSPSKA